MKTWKFTLYMGFRLIDIPTIADYISYVYWLLNPLTCQHCVTSLQVLLTIKYNTWHGEGTNSVLCHTTPSYLQIPRVFILYLQSSWKWWPETKRQHGRRLGVGEKLTVFSHARQQINTATCYVQRNLRYMSVRQKTFGCKEIPIIINVHKIYLQEKLRVNLVNWYTFDQVMLMNMELFISTKNQYKLQGT
jgi:hypothetical protein